MRRSAFFVVAGVAFIAMACSDSTAPTRSSNASSARAVAASPSFARSTLVGENASYVDVTIPAAGGTITVGPYSVYFEPNAVCVAGSGYGYKLWNKPCATRTDDVTLQAAHWEENGEIFVEFLADLRFDPDKYVIIYAKVAPPNTPRTAAMQIMYWTRTATQKVRKNEAMADRSMLTFYNPVTGEYFRRIKHFSGYVVGSGGRCTESCEEGQ